MKITNLAASPVFGRALCQKEEKGLKRASKEALSRLGIDRVSVTFFDFVMPKGEYNTGIGTTFSKEGIQTAEFANTYFGMTNMQLGPQGEVSDSIRSPYSGTTFSLGMQFIAPEKLIQDEYGNLLSKDDLDNSSYMHAKNGDDKVDYPHVFSDTEGIKPLLKQAFNNFEELDDGCKLKQEFENFKKENKYWLERDSVFEALAYELGTDDVSLWDKRSQNIYADENNIDNTRISELKKTVDKDGNNIYEFNQFVQFIADKQQQETKRTLNNSGITITGDCHIGFPEKERWAHKSAFYKNSEMFGCDRDGDGKFVTCWTPAPDLDKLDGEAGELFRQKFATLLKRNNGVRIDAAWQLVYPTIVKPDYMDENGNMRGNYVHHQPEVGVKIINILKDEAQKAGVSEDKISLEFIDGAGKSWRSLGNWEVKNAVKDMNCINTMQYMQYNWGYPRHYRSDNAGPFKHPFEILIGTHDDKGALEVAQSMSGEQIDVISRELKMDRGCFSSIKQKTQALFAMLFTNTPNNHYEPKGRVGMTITDAIGSERRINVPNSNKGNWEFRLGKNWQEEYFKNLSHDKGFNLPEAISTALKAKEGSSQLTEKLDSYARILKSPIGPMTRQEAQNMAQNGTLDVNV